MLNRAFVVDENFRKFVSENKLPKAHSSTQADAAGLDKPALLNLFSAQIISRQCDLHARELKEQGLSYYTIGKMRGNG